MNKKWLLSLIAILFGLLSYAQATPIFASKYNLDCKTCHTLIPTLNKTGLKFYRNGFRFSKDDQTMIEALFDKNTSLAKSTPIRGLAGTNIDTKSEEHIEKLNLYFAGNLTETLSLYSVTRSTYNLPVDNDLFAEENSKAFIQWNPKEGTHVVKLGWMDPLSMFSNLNRTLMDNALMGSGLLKKAPKSIVKPEWVHKTPPTPLSTDATIAQKQAYQIANMPKQPYKLPISYAGTGFVKGLEYSYLYNEKALFMLNYGIPSSSPYADQDDTQLTLGVELQDIQGYNFGLLYMHQELANIETDSYIVPIEKTFLNGEMLVQQSFIYKETNQFENPYYGSQTTLTYQLDETSHIRAIVAFDQDEDEEFASGYSLTYSKAWNDRFLLHITGASHKGAFFDEELAKLSIYLFL